MDSIYAIILGIVQALTEFLPISSSGHLVIVRDLLSFEVSDPQAFDVSLHVGSLLALICYFSSDLQKYILGFFSWVKKGKAENFEERIAYLLLLAMIPAVIVGGIFGDIFFIFQNPISIAIFLIFGGILFILTEKYVKTIKEIREMNIWDAFFVGVLQVCAFIPGVSRSGITIISGMFRQFNRFDATTFSFLLGIPVLFAAGVKKGFDLYAAQQSIDVMVFMSGMIASGIASYIVIALFMQFVKKHSLSFFGWYRIVLGGLILFLVYLNIL